MTSLRSGRGQWTRTTSQRSALPCGTAVDVELKRFIDVSDDHPVLVDGALSIAFGTAIQPPDLVYPAVRDTRDPPDKEFQNGPTLAAATESGTLLDARKTGPDCDRGVQLLRVPPLCASASQARLAILERKANSFVESCFADPAERCVGDAKRIVRLRSRSDCGQRET